MITLQPPSHFVAFSIFGPSWQNVTLDLETFCSSDAKNSLQIILKRQEPRASRGVRGILQQCSTSNTYSDARSGDGKDGTTATTKSTFGLRESSLGSSWRALIGLSSLVPTRPRTPEAEQSLPFVAVPLVISHGKRRALLPSKQPK